MKFRQLGRTDLKVSEICLGTMTWGSQNTEQEAHEQMDYAVGEGVNFFDAAELYPTTPGTAENLGRTEDYIGTWFKKSGRRSDIIMATKIAGGGVKRIRDGSNISKESLPIALDTSLKRLQTDYIDLYQLHWPNRGSYAFRQIWKYDPSKQIPNQVIDENAEIAEAMGQIIKSGKVRHFGLSNETAWGLTQFLKLSETNDVPRVASLQNEYNLMCRYFSPDLEEICHLEGVSLLPYSPLAAGLLTGKYSGNAIPEGSRRSINNDLGGRFSKRAPIIADLYVDIARRHGLDPAQMALAFTLHCPQVAATIIGSTNMDQLKTCVGAYEVTLSDEVLAEIAQVRFDHPMPY